MCSQESRRSSSRWWFIELKSGCPLPELGVGLRWPTSVHNQLYQLLHQVRSTSWVTHLRREHKMWFTATKVEKVHQAEYQQPTMGRPQWCRKGLGDWGRELRSPNKKFQCLLLSRARFLFFVSLHGSFSLWLYEDSRWYPYTRLSRKWERILRARYIQVDSRRLKRNVTVNFFKFYMISCQDSSQGKIPRCCCCVARERKANGYYVSLSTEPWLSASSIFWLGP